MLFLNIWSDALVACFFLWGDMTPFSPLPKESGLSRMFSGLLETVVWNSRLPGGISVSSPLCICHVRDCRVAERLLAITKAPHNDRSFNFRLEWRWWCLCRCLVRCIRGWWVWGSEWRRIFTFFRHYLHCFCTIRCVLLLHQSCYFKRWDFLPRLRSCLIHREYLHFNVLLWVW